MAGTRITVDGKTFDFSEVRSKSPFEDFLMINQQFFIVQSKNQGSPAKVRVRDWILGHADRENLIFGLSPTELAMNLEISISSTSRALASLVNDGLIEKEGGHYRLSPSVGWKGSTVNHKAALKQKHNA
jgi:predicted HTH transcriptional regulator